MRIHCLLFLLFVAVSAVPDQQDVLDELGKLSYHHSNQDTLGEKDETRIFTYSNFISQHKNEVHKGNWMGNQLAKAGFHLESLQLPAYNPDMMLNDSASTVDDMFPLFGMELDFIPVNGQPAYPNETYTWVAGRIERSNMIPVEMRQIAVYIYTPLLKHDATGLPLQPLKGYNASTLAIGGIETGSQNAPLPRNKQFPLDINGNGWGDDHIPEYHDSTKKECKQGTIQMSISYHPGSATENIFDNTLGTRSKIVQFLVADFIAVAQYAWIRSHTCGDRLHNTINWDIPVKCKGHSFDGVACECLVNGCPEFGIHQPYSQFGISFTRDSASGWVFSNTTLANYNAMRLNVPSEDAAGPMQEWRVRESNTNPTLNVNAMLQRWSHQMFQWSIIRWLLVIFATGDWVNGYN